MPVTTRIFTFLGSGIPPATRTNLRLAGVIRKGVNQFGISYNYIFPNKFSTNSSYVDIPNTHGSVMGKTSKIQAKNLGNRNSFGGNRSSTAPSVGNRGTPHIWVLTYFDPNSYRSKPGSVKEQIILISRFGLRDTHFLSCKL